MHKDIPQRKPIHGELIDINILSEDIIPRSRPPNLFTFFGLKSQLSLKQRSHILITIQKNFVKKTLVKRDTRFLPLYANTQNNVIF